MQEWRERFHRSKRCHYWRGIRDRINKLENTNGEERKGQTGVMNFYVSTLILPHTKTK